MCFLDPIRSNPTPTPATMQQFARQLTVRVPRLSPRNLRDGSVRFPYQEANSIVLGRSGANIDKLRQTHGKMLTDIKVRIASNATPCFDSDIKLFIDHDDDAGIKARIVIVPRDDAASPSFDTVIVTVSANGQPRAKGAFLTLFHRVRTMYCSALDLVGKKRSERIDAEDYSTDLSIVSCRPPPLDDDLSFPKLSA